MNILSIGTPLFPSFWRAAGHRVMVVADVSLAAHEDNRPFDLFKEPLSCATRIAAVIDDFEPDVIFQGDHSAPLVHAGIESIALPRAWYAIDTHLHLAWHRHYATLFDHVYCAQKNMVTAMSAQMPSTGWLPVFCQRPAVFLPWPDRLHDVAFVGTIDANKNPERVRLLDSLKSRGIPLHLATGAYAPVYQTSRIVVNQSVNDDLNLRVFEAMGCGSLLVTDRITHSLQELFDEGRDYLAYAPGDADDCAGKIGWALQHPTEAERIASNGHEKVVACHCEEHRAAQVLEMLQSLASAPPAPIVDPDTRAAHLAWVFDHCSRLALPTALTDFFYKQAERQIPRGRTSVQGRSWTLLVSAGQAIDKGNGLLAGALLSQITELPQEKEFRCRYYALKAAAFALAGDRAGAREVLDYALREYPEERELREIAGALTATDAR